MHELIESLRGKPIVSVQAYPGEPTHHPETMAQIARTVQIGGTAAIHCQGLADISAIRGCVEVPIIGLWEEGHEGVYITPSLCHARACVMAGCNIVAINTASRPHPDGCTFAETCQTLREESVLVVADRSPLGDAEAAYEAGINIISTTLAGYTGDHEESAGLDLELLKEIAAAYPDAAVICEDRIHAPQDAIEAMNAGTFAVIVGMGITHPTPTTTWLKDVVEKR